MGAYVRRRLLTMIPVVLGVSLIVFLMLHLLPGDPVMMMLTEHRGGGAPTISGNITQEMYDNMRHQLGLDRPLPVQFASFLGGVLRGDLGTSFRGGEPVLELIARNLPYTIQLAAASLGVAMLLGFALGVIAGVKRGTWIDSLTMTIAAAGVSIPSFWLGIMLLVIFAVHLKLVPAVGRASDLQSLILPAVALGFAASAFIARLVRSSLVETLQQDYVRTARAKGLRETGVVVGHALKNALIPVVTVVGLQFGNLLGGTVVIETVFARPGIGHIVVNGILERDFPVVQGVVLVSALTYVFANFLVDLTYTWIDPRIRFGGAT
jgi:ABC-type dipeptide/oligopeptide/nickel transport system permease component